MTPRPASDWFFALLALFTLVSFAVAQSLYEMLAGNPLFMALRVSSNWQLLLIVLVFNWLPVLLLFALWLLLWRLHPAAARIFLTTVFFLLFLTFFFQLDNAYFLKHWPSLRHSYALWIVPAAVVSLLHLRFPRAFRAFVLVLSPVIVIFPALFLLRTWIDSGHVYAQEEAQAQQVSPAASAQSLPPVFLIILDELALDALLDESGQIDATRFPHLRELAAESYWFRNSTANADYTTQSIPSLLTGNFPLPQAAPAYYVYPKNLFTLLHPHYQVYAYETWTRFCVPRAFHCANPLHEDTSSHLDLFRDLLSLYAERVRPGGTDVGFDDTSRAWALFRDQPRLVRTYLERFENFLDLLSGVHGPQPVFFYFHNGLPHSPYWVSVEGRIVEANPGEFRFAQRGNPAALGELFERYQAQIMYVDKQMGRLVMELKRLGLYDRSLLIVTSDHGVSYHPDAPGRKLKEIDGRVVNAELILGVPLLIKLPFQKEGVVSDKDVQLIDLVPTIADVLHMKVPWPTAGRSAFAPATEPRVKVAYDENGKRFEFPDSLGLSRVGVRFEGVGETEGACAGAR
ncbi:MAG TPA: sulfatase-like hydrolase/transferase [Candidatus Acidoferrales bacterium]|nr:sulfatase-like hydrolase/transferase [Candidatus Acidoferrales bacterium]